MDDALAQLGVDSRYHRDGWRVPCTLRRLPDRWWEAAPRTFSGLVALDRESDPCPVTARLILRGRSLGGGIPVCDDAATRAVLIDARGLDWFLAHAR